MDLGEPVQIRQEVQSSDVYYCTPKHLLGILSVSHIRGVATPVLKHVMVGLKRP
jgi:hypothetical protein